MDVCYSSYPLPVTLPTKLFLSRVYAPCPETLPLSPPLSLPPACSRTYRVPIAGAKNVVRQNHAKLLKGAVNAKS